MPRVYSLPPSVLLVFMIITMQFWYGIWRHEYGCIDCILWMSGECLVEVLLVSGGCLVFLEGVM